MKISRLVLLLAGASGTVLFGQQDAEFTAWMKITAASTGALNKMESKTGMDAMRAAERIGGVYEQMIGYWRQKDAPDAVKWSVEGKAAAAELASAAHGGDSEKATAALKMVGATCRPCHEGYREKLEDGTYRIRMKAKQ